MMMKLSLVMLLAVALITVEGKNLYMSYYSYNQSKYLMDSIPLTGCSTSGVSQQENVFQFDDVTFNQAFINPTSIGCFKGASGQNLCATYFQLSGLVIIDVDAGKLVTQNDFVPSLRAPAVVGDQWIGFSFAYNPQEGSKATLQSIDLATFKPTTIATFPSVYPPSGLPIPDAGLYLMMINETYSAINLSTGEVVGTYALGLVPPIFAVGNGVVGIDTPGWQEGNWTIVPINPITGDVISNNGPTFPSPFAIAGNFNTASSYDETENCLYLVTSIEDNNSQISSNLYAIDLSANTYEIAPLNGKLGAWPVISVW